MSNRQSYYIGVKGIIKDKDGRVLVLKDSSTGKWEVPGGRIDAGQSIKDAFSREIQEEIEGSSLKEFGSLIFAAPGDFLVENAHKLLLLFYAVKVQLPVQLTLSPEHTDVAWVDVQSLPDYTIYSSDKAAITIVLNAAIQ